MKLDAVQEAFGKGRREVPARNCGFVREMASFKKSNEVNEYMDCSYCVIRSGFLAVPSRLT